MGPATRDFAERIFTAAHEFARRNGMRLQEDGSFRIVISNSMHGALSLEREAFVDGGPYYRIWTPTEWDDDPDFTRMFFMGIPVFVDQRLVGDDIRIRAEVKA